MNASDTAWFTERTSRAPERLRARAEAMLAGTSSSHPLTQRLAEAGRNALAAATAAGTGRAAALDLLAADGLLTLALLAAAERAPEHLGATARALRMDHLS